jgi:hypothetical protein
VLTFLAGRMQLVLAAERQRADLVVLGRREESTFKRWMLVLRYAHLRGNTRTRRVR